MILSVIIPFSSELNLINRTINSVIVNSKIFDLVEIIIINDGIFKDNDIRSIIEKKNIDLIKIIKNKYTKGPGGARNTGIDNSKGDVIAFLDADDFWLPRKLEAQIQKVKEGATFVATSYRFDKSKTIINAPLKIKNSDDIFLNRGIATSTVLITKELLDNKRFRDIRFGQDIDFWYNLSKSKKFKFASIPEVFAEYSTSGSTKNKWVQLYYVNKILHLNNISILIRIRFNISYILTGIYNHFIRNLFKKNL